MLYTAINFHNSLSISENIARTINSQSNVMTKLDSLKNRICDVVINKIYGHYTNIQSIPEIQRVLSVYININYENPKGTKACIRCSGMYTRS